MAWTMRLPDGSTASSDDFTLGDLGRLEEETGEPWSTLNPLRTLKVAKAYLKVAYRSAGLDEDDVESLTLGTMKNAFGWVDDEPWPGDAREGDDADPPVPSSDGSSRGASGGSTGSRRRRASSASATSS